MEEKILVNLCTDHTLECDTNILGREGEGHTARFWISVPEKLRTCSIYLDFKKPNGEKLRTPKLEVENGVAHYDVVPYLLTDEGEVQVQLVVKTASGGTWKTHIKKYYNYDSINAEDYINESLEKTDFIHEAQKVLDELSGEINEIASILSNNTSFVDNIINRVEEINIEEVETLKDSVEIIQDDIQSVQGDITSIQDDITGIQEGVETIQENVDTHEGNIRENTNGIMANQYAIERNGNKIESLIANIVKPVAEIEISHLYSNTLLPEEVFEKIKNSILFMIVTTSTGNYSDSGIMFVGDDINGRYVGALGEGYVAYDAEYTGGEHRGNYLSFPDCDLIGTDNCTLRFYKLYSIAETRATSSFYINGKFPRDYEVGMTWEEWVKSEYNLLGKVYISTVDDKVYYRSGIYDAKDGSVKLLFKAYGQDEETQPHKDDEISAKGSYKTSTTAPDTISFIITNGGSFTKTYTALVGMTWEEWVKSEYNDGRAVISDDYVYFDLSPNGNETVGGKGDPILYKNGYYTQTSSLVIEAGATYTAISG